MVLGNFPVPGRPTIRITVGQGPTALAVGAGGGCLDIFTLIYPFFSLSSSLWETARYRLKYCLKGSLNPKPTNQPNETAYSYQQQNSEKPILLYTRGFIDFTTVIYAVYIILLQKCYFLITDIPSSFRLHHIAGLLLFFYASWKQNRIAHMFAKLRQNKDGKICQWSKYHSLLWPCLHS